MSRHSSASHFHKSKTLNDKYILGDEIGKGAYGRVYKGLDSENGDFVAIKQVSLENIPSEDLASIMQEIDLLKNLNHKNIVKYQGSFKTKSHLYIILEYVENGSLANIIKPNKFGAFPESLVAVYIAQVLEGLVYLHEQGVIHRDIKGANILTTKEGLVKLADFGVATKLTEADVNTHSVVGTPYWMAPEVIEMSGVSAASDIWSVGCTVIELLTCVPPYYDLQPMPALFRIVQDDHPPIPEHVSAAITDFLHQCFRKDAKLRPDARTLLKHSWIRNSRRSLQSSLQRTGGKINNIPQDVSTVVERAIGDGEDPRPPSEDVSTTRYPSEFGSDDEEKMVAPTQNLDSTSSSNPPGTSIGSPPRANIPRIAPSMQRVAILNGSGQTNPSNITKYSSQSYVDKATLSSDPALQASICSLGSPKSSGLPETLEVQSSPRSEEKVENFDVSAMKSDSQGFLLPQTVSGLASAFSGEEDEVNNDCQAHHEGIKLKAPGPVKSQPNGSHQPPQVQNLSTSTSLKRFSDTPADAQLDDLLVGEPFRLHSSPSDEVVTCPPGAVSLEPVLKVAPITPSGSGLTNALAARLMARRAQTRYDGEAVGLSQKESFERLVENAEDDDSIDSGLGFIKDEGRDYLAKQAIEITRLVSLLKPDESEEAVISACQKLVAIFQEHPEQKAHLISQHGIIPLVEMLEVTNTRVLHSILQLLNQIITGNVGFQENACLVGLIPMIMNFAAPERSREIRMQAALFIQQICLTSSLTLQMFIACRGLPVLVKLLEPEYTKCKEMVHIAVDAMRQVFELQNGTRNDFCRIFAKSGVLFRLVNTLYSLNEATRGVSAIPIGRISGATVSSSVVSPGQVLLRTRSGPLEPSRTTHVESFKPRSGQLDPASVRTGYLEQRRQVTVESSRPKSPQAHKSAGLPDYLRHLPGQVDQSRGGLGSGNVTRTGISVDGGHDISWQSPSSSYQFSGERDITASQIESSRPDIEQSRPVAISGTDMSRVFFTDQPWHTSRIANVIGEPSQHEVQPLLSLLEKEPPTRPGQTDFYRNASSSTFERPDCTLPLLHHAATNRKGNGKMDSIGTGFTGMQAPSLVLPVQSPLISPPAMGTSSIHGDAPLSGTVTQRDSGQLSTSGAANFKLSSPLSPVMPPRMVSPINTEVTKEYVAKVADLLLEFSRADTVVKSHMCSVNLLIRLFQMLSKLEPVILVKMLRCIKELSTDPFTLEFLQRADAMKHLVPLLEVREGPSVLQIHSQVLNALYNLCKINKRRQEQAAESGIIPHLMYFIREDSPLQQFALPLLCDMAHASRYTREQLRAHRGLDVYLSLLNNEYWAVTALDSLAVCLAHDNDQRKVEQALLKKDALEKLVAFFQCCSGPSFVHILEPFLKIITKSVRLNTALAVSGLTPLLVGRLDHQDAIARLNLLKLIKAVYEHHPRPKQLIVEHDLPLKLRKLIEERRDGERSGGQVLVKQMATALLKALHINTVL